MVDMSIHMREPIRDSILSGPEWVREVLYGYLNRVYKVFRMERHIWPNTLKNLKLYLLSQIYLLSHKKSLTLGYLPILP